MQIWWGQELVLLHNDACLPLLGASGHVHALGRCGHESWPALWPVIGPILAAVQSRGEPATAEDLRVDLSRRDRIEECYFTFSFSPIRDESAAIGGIMAIATETTGRVLAARRLRVLRELAACARQAGSMEEACGAAARTLARHPSDISFALLYLLDEDHGQARLVGSSKGLSEVTAGPQIVDLRPAREEAPRWPLARVARTGRAELSAGPPARADPVARAGSSAGAEWPDGSCAAMCLPMTEGSAQRPFGVLVAGISPRRPLDEEYHGFLHAVAAYVATAVAWAGVQHAEAQERRQAEAALHESNREISSILESIGDAFTSIDRGWRVTYANRQVLALAGMSAEEMIGQILWVLFPGLIGSPIEAAYRKVMEEQVPVQVEVQGILSGRWFQTSIYPSTGGISVYGRDVTERWLMEAALRESEERFRTFMWNSPVQVFIKDAEGRYVYVNRASERVFHGQHASIVGMTDFDLFPAAMADKLRENDHIVLATGEPRQFIESILKPQGELYALVSKFPMRSSDGRCYLGGIAVDITAQKRAEQALQQADRRKDEFLAMLAHELRNPLAPIRSAVALLRLSDSLDPRLQWARDVIDRQTEHLTRLVDDLLDVSRITQGKVTIQKEALALADVVARAVETSRPLIDACRHRLTVSLPSAPVWLEGDRTRLAQVLANLLNNAAKYTEEGGRIDLVVEQAGEEAVVRVRDTGMGISAEALPHVFDLFTQAARSLDRAQGGLGIGLTLARRVVEMHGGRVDASSAGPGMGSELVVRLPALRRAGDETGRALASTAPAARMAGRRILVVDDNADATETMAMLLERIGHEVRMAYDGPTALQMARTFAPEVVLLDIGLPGMDGYEVARRLRGQEGAGRPLVVALTGYGQEEDRRRTREAGFDHHLVKPVDVAMLQALLRAL